MSADRTLSFRPRSNGRRQQREAFDAIRVGSVIRWKGRLRTVRRVTRLPDGLIYAVSFAKLKRSGYTSPLTIYHRSEIRCHFGGIVAHRKGPLCAVDLECRLSAAIDAGRDAGRDAAVTEHETVGVVW